MIDRDRQEAEAFARLRDGVRSVYEGAKAAGKPVIPIDGGAGFWTVYGAPSLGGPLAYWTPDRDGERRLHFESLGYEAGSEHRRAAADVSSDGGHLRVLKAAGPVLHAPC